MNKTYTITQNNKTILSITIEKPDNVEYTDIQWDSKTGLVTAIINGERVPIPYSGGSAGAISPENFQAENFTGISFNYWYY